MTMPKTRNLMGERFGKLIVKEKLLEREDRYFTWCCQCDCGRECIVVPHELKAGKTKSCGCRKREIQENIQKQLTFVDGSCIEWLSFRKTRCDNTSGFRGVSSTRSGKWKAIIGLQSKRYYLGTYETYEEAVSARLDAEEPLHTGFVNAYRQWSERAACDKGWGIVHSFFFHVERRNKEFVIHTVDSENYFIKTSS